MNEPRLSYLDAVAELERTARELNTVVNGIAIQAISFRDRERAKQIVRAKAAVQDALAVMGRVQP